MSFIDPAALNSAIVTLAFVGGGVVAGLAFEFLILRQLKKLTAKTEWPGDDVILASLKGAFIALFTTLGLFGAVRSNLTSAEQGATAERVLTVVLILLSTWVLAKIVSGLVQMYSRQVGDGFLSTSMMSNLSRFLVILLGGLTVLQYLNISITPILTALGVGGLGIALALQDTLATLFAGLHIIASKQIKPGDYVKLSTGEEGFVADITWRYTNIRSLANTITIVPNAQMSKAVVTNFNLPEQETSILVPIGVSYDSDLEKVERVTIEVAREVMQSLEGGVPEFEPLVRYHTFGDSGIHFNVLLRGRHINDQYPLKHALIKRLHRRYREEGIEIPFPTRTLHIR